MRNIHICGKIIIFSEANIGTFPNLKVDYLIVRMEFNIIFAEVNASRYYSEKVLSVSATFEKLPLKGIGYRLS